MLYDRGQGTASDAKELGQLAHTRGMMIAMLQVEAIRTAQEKYGKGKVMTSEQVRWGLENMNGMTQERLNEKLGFGKILRPFKTSCENHMGADWSRIAQWDGTKFTAVSDWYQADKSLIDPLVKEYGEKYAKEKSCRFGLCTPEALRAFPSLALRAGGERQLRCGATLARRLRLGCASF